MEKLDGLDVCVGPVNDFAEAFADPQARHRDMLVEEDLAGVGAWTHVGNPIRLQEAPGEVVRRPPPGLGQHTEEVLREAGLADPEIEELRAAGAI
jgi:crotonobetainyl-CoA:carnitine CoA-transferase CaiB-like acyl-CoA transferase